MDVQAAETSLNDSPRESWFAREKASGRIYHWATIASAVLLAATLAASFLLLRREAQPGSMLSPPQIALLLIANLIPSIALMVLVSRKLANARAARRAIGTGQLHTRLVALFSVIAAVPTVLVAIFASLLLQSGLEFWKIPSNWPSRPIPARSIASAPRRWQWPATLAGRCRKTRSAALDWRNISSSRPIIAALTKQPFSRSVQTVR